MVGQKVAVLCCRYQYRGVLSRVYEDGLALSNATSVEISGPSQSEEPDTEDNIASTIFISKNTVELIYQPRWVFAPLPSEAVET